MSFMFQFSRRLLYFLIIVFGILELVMLVMFISLEMVAILWYASLVMLLLIAITWVVYRHSKNKQIEEEEKQARNRPKFTPDGEDPRIGHTYE